jgi:hypothetical protein
LLRATSDWHRQQDWHPRRLNLAIDGLAFFAGSPRESNRAPAGE